jgi:hypothetical protein
MADGRRRAQELIVIRVEVPGRDFYRASVVVAASIDCREEGGDHARDDYEIGAPPGGLRGHEILPVADDVASSLTSVNAPAGIFLTCVNT